MPDDPSTATAGTGEATASPEAAASAEAQAAAPQVDYAALLDSIPEDVLRQHRRFNGIVGSHAQRLAEEQRQRIATEEYAKAQKAKQEELEREAQENPFAFTQKWLGERAREKAELELSELRTKAQQTLFEKVASSYSALPEWQQLTPDEFAKVQQQVAGKADDELVAAFNIAALDVLAARRASSMSERAVQERLASERLAWEQEYQARRLRGETTPDMSMPASANGISDSQAIRNMTPAEFDEFYNKQFRT